MSKQAGAEQVPSSDPALQSGQAKSDRQIQSYGGSSAGVSGGGCGWGGRIDQLIRPLRKDIRLKMTFTGGWLDQMKIRLA